MIYGYARISTFKQIAGNGLEDQKNVLRSRGCDEIIIEQFTGKTTDRPKFNKLLSQLTNGDTLMVTKLDRLARSASEGNEVIQSLIGKGVTVVIDNMGTLSNKPMDKLMVTMMLAFAEFERTLIIERTQAGKEIAKTKAGFKDGRPKKYNEHQIQHGLNLLKDNSYTKVEAMTGISIATLARAKRDQSQTLT
jgi:DNA invertase Pin-like site-specific DNA recombinase